jgi:hypothetical protein
LNAAVNVDGDRVIVTAPIATEYDRTPELNSESVASIINAELPMDVGLPEITPDPEPIDKPPGRAPCDTLYVYDPMPPDAVIVWLYGTFCKPLGNVDGFTVTDKINCLYELFIFDLFTGIYIKYECGIDAPNEPIKIISSPMSNVIGLQFLATRYSLIPAFVAGRF